MRLSSELDAELRRRLALSANERGQRDSAYGLPSADRWALLALLLASGLAMFLIR